MCEKCITENDSIINHSIDQLATQKQKFKVAILTISDRVSRGEATDTSGPALANLIDSLPNYITVSKHVVPDEKLEIQKMIITLDSVDLILTTGGTGFGKRDITPEAVREIIHKDAPGLTIAMISSSLSITPLAALSRPVCGVRNHTLIVTLPGSKKGSSENLQAILPILHHAIDLIRDDKKSSEGLHSNIHGGHKLTSNANTTKPLPTSFNHHSCHHHDHLSPEARDGPLSNDPNASVTRRARISPYPIISFEDALNIVLTLSNRNTIEKKEINSNLTGYVLAKDIQSFENVPAYRASIVDGYAVIHSDGPGIYQVMDASLAGASDDSKQKSIVTGQIMRVTTGAPIPAGTTAVVMVEDTKLIKASDDGLSELQVEILSPIREGENIREIGSDISKGQTILSSGQRMTAIGGEVAVLASVGISEVEVYRKPVVAVLSTGNELVDSDTKGSLKFGQIRDANRPALKSVIESCGFSVLDLGIGPDNADSLAKLISKGLESADVLITTGGVSMGEMDLLKPVIERNLKGTIHFGRVKLKPGKPTTFATVPGTNGNENSKLVFALPGNPVSALVTFYLFVLPSLRKLSGYEDPMHPTIKVTIQQDIILDPRPEFYRVNLQNTGQAHWMAVGTGLQRSSRVVNMVSANALLKLPASSESLRVLKSGSLVDAILLD
ncbi:hypothetical protein BC833DRAFT_593251, partial [Globomyces pollinis-pini]